MAAPTKKVPTHSVSKGGVSKEATVPGTRVIKFGGSSVGSPERITRVIDIFSDPKRYPAGCLRAVVVSAFQGITDQLIAIAHQAARPGERDVSCGRTSSIDSLPAASLPTVEARHLDAISSLIPAAHRSATLASAKVLINELSDVIQGVSLVGECTPRTLDLIMSFGERLSAFIVHASCEARGIECELLDTRTLIVTNDAYGNALLDRDTTFTQIERYFATHPKLQIATGFIASTRSGATTTLGRGGSDYTAAILGAAIDVSEIEIWTDVDGMLTADPRKVSKAFPIPGVTVEEAMELCHFGAKVIYPPTIQPAVDAGIPLLIKNTFNPDALGTRIARQAVQHDFSITGISSIGNIALLRIQGSGMVGVAGVAMRFFKALASRRINIILITQASSEHTICCAIDPKSAPAAQECIDEEFSLEMQAGLISPLVIEDDLAIVSVVGERMRQTPGISGRVFTALGHNGINVVAIAQGSSELNISAVIPARDEAKALNALHDEFFVSSSKTLNLWIAGTGLIGSTLLKQIAERTAGLRDSAALDLSIRGLANSRRMRLTQDRATSLSVTDALRDEDQPFSSTQMVSHILSANLPNCIFVDCSASEELPSLYPALLEACIAVVTPNKRGIAGLLSQYNALKLASMKRRTPFLHETCVGAGLPILSTLSDLVRSGDTVQRIEAILSGTLSYIFNSFDATTSFSQAVMKAKELGLTEPDPRDDLSGLDVARKVLILAREAGLDLEFNDITIDPLLPPEALAGTKEDFIRTLPELDDQFESKRVHAANLGQRLFFASEIDCENRRATIALRAVSLDHPFCGLRGSDNIVAFSTRRYASQPLVIKGPGAGAEVTAAGVFADIIRIGR